MTDDLDAAEPSTPWLTPSEAATRARCSDAAIYAAIRAGKLRAVRIGARMGIKLHVEWVDAWLRSATLLNPDAPGDDVPLPLSFSGRKTGR